MKTLMTGATAKFAGLVLPQFKKQGHHVTTYRGSTRRVRYTDYKPLQVTV